MSKALITGCDGLIGFHLAHFLLERGMCVIGTVFENPSILDEIANKAILIPCDFRDRPSVEGLVKEAKPEYIFHLAAQSLVKPSWDDPVKTFTTNIFGTLYLLEAVKKEGLNPRIVVACSSAEYGTTHENEIPIKETKEFRPTSPYGVSKIGTDMISLLYWHIFGMQIVRVRPFNVTGPAKMADASSDFARGIVEIEKGTRRFLEVGNVDRIRDILDVRDAINAIWVLAERGIAGEVYNICSGQGYQIRDILEKLLGLSSVKVEVRVSEEKFRPGDEPVYIGDNSKLRDLGWHSEYSIDRTLSDTLQFWRNHM